MTPALVVAFVAMSTTPAWNVVVQGCANRVYDGPSVTRALDVEWPEGATDVHVRLPDCQDTSEVVIEIPTAEPHLTRTATVSLRDVPPGFYARTLALVAVDLGRRDQEAAAIAKRGTWVDVGITLGAAGRLRIGAQETATAIPFVAIDTHWAWLSPFLLAASLNYEPIVSESFLLHGVRLGVGPGVRTGTDRLRIVLGAQYFGGVAFLKGRGPDALAQVTVVPVHGAAAYVDAGWNLSEPWRLGLRLEAGYEFGAQGLRFQDAVTSTHGPFARLALRVAFNWPLLGDT